MVKSIFLSFDPPDQKYAHLFKNQIKNSNFEIDFFNSALKVPYRNPKAGDIKSQIRPMIDNSSVTVCLIGANTFQNDWVDWEIYYSNSVKKGLLGVRINTSSLDEVPQRLSSANSLIVNWDPAIISIAINKVIPS